MFLSASVKPSGPLRFQSQRFAYTVTWRGGSCEHFRLAPAAFRAQLEEWVREFVAHGHQVASVVRVVEQEDADGQDTSLVVVGLVHASGSVYVESRGYDDPLWQATLTGSDTDETLTPYALAGVAAELVVAGNLCAFLQWKSLEWDRKSGTR
ncbi:hypothetical protein [uncultured Microbacterium sp.]|uniref:hypothetical protein n=1 Tax=uncultured Microbacterium sp. TaxID=191216 RepID=UPI0028D3B13D|nr:hypothetical protein [uncultured Microbacterium sp.]